MIDEKATLSPPTFPLQGLSRISSFLKVDKQQLSCQDGGLRAPRSFLLLSQIPQPSNSVLGPFTILHFPLLEILKTSTL